jgi:hypothetical protein
MRAKWPEARIASAAFNDNPTQPVAVIIETSAAIARRVPWQEIILA